MERTLKPPLGAKPRFIVEQERIKELKGAITRAMEASWPFLQEWIDEYNTLVKRLPTTE